MKLTNKYTQNIGFSNYLLLVLFCVTLSLFFEICVFLHDKYQFLEKFFKLKT